VARKKYVKMTNWNRLNVYPVICWRALYAEVVSVRIDITKNYNMEYLDNVLENEPNCHVEFAKDKHGNEFVYVVRGEAFEESLEVF
jgi:hypothetical protein